MFPRSPRLPILLPTCLALLASLVASRAHAQTIPPAVVSDGAGGVIVAWEDSRHGERNIYAQRLGAGGARMWADSGVVVCAAIGHQIGPVIVADGAGGAIVAWQDSRAAASDVYAQRLSPAGVSLWAPDGVPVSAAAGYQFHPTIAADGIGGAILAWDDTRSGNFDVYAQRLSSGGTPVWAIDGVPVCGAPGQRSNPHIASDGAYGVVVDWGETRAGVQGIYAQRLGPNGAPKWISSGVVVHAAGGLEDLLPAIASDEAGGAIACWEARSTTSDSIAVLMQQIDSTGALGWGAAGVRVSTSSDWQRLPVVVADGSGGAIANWLDFALSSNGPLQVLAQRVDAGARSWDIGGVAVGPTQATQTDPVLLGDGAGGAITAWDDVRAGYSSGPSWDIYAQRLTPAGEPAWAAGGVAVCGALGVQTMPSIAGDADGGAIIVWNDFRGWSPPSALDSTLFAQRVDANGATLWSPEGVRVYFRSSGSVLGAGPGPESRGATLAVANPAPGGIHVMLSLPDSRPATLELIDVSGRRVAGRSLAGLAAGPHGFDLPVTAAGRSGLYFVRLVTAGETLTRKTCFIQ